MAIIDKPSDYFETVIYAGGTTDISSLDFQPDWVWAKKRTGAENHGLFDSIRGATKTLNSNTTAAESTRSGSLTSFDSDGFTMGGSDGIISASGNNYVAWSWKAGTSFTNDASATGIGTIDSAGSVNNDSGFSICSFTGTGSAGTIKHGLSSAPSMIIQKSRTSALNWKVYHKSLGATKYINLDETGAAGTASTIWNDTEPTSSVYSVGTGNTNSSSVNYIAYCFAEKQGYSKFGSYTGNGNADGPFIYTGFKPAFVLVKATTVTNENWLILDNKRDSFNPQDSSLYPNLSNAEDADGADYFDFVSNGMKPRTTNGGSNRAIPYIYMAFAESPFVASNFNVATAR